MQIVKLKFLIFWIFLFCSCTAHCSITICSWNLKDFGNSKSDVEIAFIATILKSYDVIAIQEVVAGPGGAQAVVRLVNTLNEKGSKWDYSISDPTSSSAYKTERYAYIWRTAKVRKQGKAWLEKKYALEIDREPYYLSFKAEGKSITLVNFHAITKSKQPETEVKYFKFLPAYYPDKLLFFVGDFNLPQSHTVFNPLKKMGYQPLFVNQKTSLRRKCINNDCLASEFDNMYIMRSKCRVIQSGIDQFYEELDNFSDARAISDHVPVFAEIEIL